MFEIISDQVLFVSCLLIVFASLYISWKQRFIQVRGLPELFRMCIESYKKRKETTCQHTILPHRALLTAMSTTIGIGTIVGPVIAIRWGGPGALLGFLITAFLGSAATYTEVSLSIKHRKQLESGEIQGGPMQYLKALISPFAAAWYAFFGSILMIAWSAAQANQLAAILDSPLLGDWRISPYISGAFLAVFVLCILVGGIQRISSFSAKLVPMMFVLYLGSIAWILLTNLGKMPAIFEQIFTSAFSPYALATGGAVGGIVSAMRWGIFKGTQVTEAGVGTQTIPHSMAKTEDPHSQGLLAMLSIYTAGLIAFFSGCVALITETWQDPNMPLGISMVAASFQNYFSIFGIGIVLVSTLLFGFGTILGNSYNGSQCFSYFVDSRKVSLYYIATAVIIYIGTISGVKTVWSVIDLGLALIVLPHLGALMLHVSREPFREPAKVPSPVILDDRP